MTEGAGESLPFVFLRALLGTIAIVIRFSEALNEGSSALRQYGSRWC